MDKASIPSNIISGTLVSKVQRDKIKDEVTIIKECQGSYITQLPRLDVIIVGDRKDSVTYVNNKTKACDEVGFLQQCHRVSENISQTQLEKIVSDLNADPEVTAILLQLPLPPHLNSAPVLELISPEKDADGLTTSNFGILFRDGVDASIIPCTPHGCIQLLRHYEVPISGANVVVIGRSILVGKPVSLLLQSENATVTMCHSRTVNLEEIVQRADIVVAAVGHPNFVKGSWIKKGAVVIDVGINVVPDNTKNSGVRLVGDVEFDSAVENARLITPVPGGVGPMTVAMLLRNTLNAFYLQSSRKIIRTFPEVDDFTQVEELDVKDNVPRCKYAKIHGFVENTLKQHVPAQVILSMLSELGLNNFNEDISIFVEKIKQKQ